ncbi:MAG: hypothetical protein R6U57_03180 [Anaerolineales bacterium]
MKTKQNPTPSITRLQTLFSEERGVTLVEELVTVAVIGLGIVILVAMITTGAVGVRQIDDRVKAETLARSQLELIKDADYQPDPTAIPYPPVTTSPDYSVTIHIEYWNASTETFSPNVRDDGLQRITVSVTSDGEGLVQIAEYKVDRE